MYSYTFLSGFCHPPKNFLTAMTFGLVIYPLLQGFPTLGLTVRKASVVSESQLLISAADMLLEGF